ncbi:MAG: AbrB/MazE/SpoVT family DNA-binding domain-containing protein [Candidatus Woesearchaeota archaeon]
MDVTKMSTKGQIVIPEAIRKGFKPGAAFVVTKTRDLIVLKPIKGMSKKQIEEMEELDRIWRDIEQGKGKRYTQEEFFKELHRW